MKTLLLLCMAMVFVTAASQATIIEFRNADFEDDSGYTGAYGESGTTHEWYFGGWLAQGENIVAWTPSTGGYIAQSYVEDDLGNQLTIAEDNDFSISFDLSSQFDGPGYNTPLRIEIWTTATSQLVGQSADITIDDTVSGVFQPVTIDFSVDGTGFVGHTYAIALKNAKGQIWVDNFSGTVLMKTKSLISNGSFELPGGAATYGQSSELGASSTVGDYGDVTPTGWHRSNEEAGQYGSRVWYMTDDGAGQFPDWDYAVRIDGNSDLNGIDVLSQSNLNLDAGTCYELSFYLWGEAANTQIDVNLSGADTISVLNDHVTVGDDGVAERVVAFITPTVTGSYTIEFSVDTVSTSNHAWIDDVVFDEYEQPPTGLTAALSSGTVILDWDDNVDPDHDYCNVYRRIAEHSQFKLIAGNVDISYYVDNDVDYGMVYFYHVTAVDTSENESGYSNQAYASLRHNGDIAGCCSVDFQDIALLNKNWLDADCSYCSGADLNNDQQVNLQDMAVVAQNWLAEYGQDDPVFLMDPIPNNPAVIPTPQAYSGWWMTRHNNIVAGIIGMQVDLLMIGDSITHNYEGNEFPHKMFLDIWNDYYAPKNAINLGYSGDTTANVIWRLQNGEIDNISPKAAVILIGTNNSYYNQSADQIFFGVRKVIEVLNEKQPQCKVLLVGILPSDVWGHQDPQQKSATDRQANSMLCRFYQKDDNVHFLNISDIFFDNGILDHTLFYDPVTYGGGPLHPNTEGQRNMAEAIEPTLQKLMNE